MPGTARSTSIARTDLDTLRERIRRIETPRYHDVLPFGIAAIDGALPGGGLPLGALHEVLGTGADEEDGAASAGFIAGILARLGAAPGLAAAPHPPLHPPLHQWRDPITASQWRDSEDVANSLRLRPFGKPALLRPAPGAFPSRPVPDCSASCPVPNSSRLRPLPDPGPLAKGGSGEAATIGAGSGVVLWCLKRPDLHGPGLLAHGLDPARVVLVTARRGDEVLWAVEEALRAGRETGLAAIVAEIGRLPMVAGRRLQLAAERSGVTAFLLRRWRGAAEAATERERPSAALTRWRIAALPATLGDFFLRNPIPQWGRGGEIAATGVFGTGLGRPRWRVELLRVRGGAPGEWEVEIADATGHVRFSAGLADRPAAPRWPRAGPAIRRAG